MPSLSIKVGGVWKTVTALSIKVGGVWKTVTTASVRVGGVWKNFLEPSSGGGGGGGGGPGSLTVVLSPDTLSKDKLGTGASATVVSPAYAGTIGVTGYTGSLSYSWSRYSAPYPTSAFTVVNGSTATPNWSARVNDGDGAVEVWRLTVQDSIGNTGWDDLTVTLNYTDTGTS